MTGFLCFLIFLVGASIAMLSRLNKRHRRGAEVTGHLLISFSFFLYGLVSSHILRTAPPPETTGTVSALKFKTSRMGVNYTTVQPLNGSPTITVHSEFSANELKVGDQVHIRYSDSDNGLLELDVLSGQAKGFVLQENDSAVYHVIFLFGGLLFLGTAWLSAHKGPTRNVTA